MSSVNMFEEIKVQMYWCFIVVVVVVLYVMLLANHCCVAFMHCCW